jgi:alpha-L-rhamnosidase
VRVWNEFNQPSDWSVSAWWETGIKHSEWRGQWIGASLVGGPRTSVPCPYLRKTFSIDKPIKSARLYATALGLYEFHLNGSQVGDDVFTPGWTDYRKRVQYQTYDVTGFLQQGENVAGAILGDGWYCGYVGWFERQFYGERSKLLVQLMVEFDDGSREVIVTDSTWKTAFGPILEADLLIGESYDARLEWLEYTDFP